MGASAPFRLGVARQPHAAAGVTPASAASASARSPRHGRLTIATFSS